MVQKEQNGELTAYYFVNDGIYQSFLVHIFDPDQLVNYGPMLPKGDDGNNRPKYNSTVWGRTCASKDFIFEGKLITEMNPGEHFVINNFGAYTYSLRSEFNGFQYPKVKYVISENNRKYLE